MRPTLRAAAAAAALILAGCREPTRPVAPSEPHRALSASSVSGGTIAYQQLVWQCGRDMMQGCDGDGPPGWNWVTRPQLATIRADGTGYTSLIDFDEYGTDPRPVWSPDGMQIAYQQGGEIFMVGGAGGTPRNLSAHAAVDGEPAWSPDGARLVFVSDRDGARDLYVMRAADGAGVTRLTSGVGGVAHPDWSRDGAYITFDCVVDAGNVDVCRIDAAGTGLVRLTTAPGYDGGADWSGAGRIAFAIGRYGAGAEIVVMNGDGSAVTRVAPGVTGMEPDWSPDGSGFVFSSGALEVHVMGADGSNPVLLASLASSPSWRPTDTALPTVQLPTARLGPYTCLELTCTLDGSGSTDDAGTKVLNYSWSFGDGTSPPTYTATPRHAFPAAGTYTVTLTVTAVATGKSATTTQSVTVTGQPVGAPPFASFTFSCAGLTCTLDGRGSTDDAGITRYSWSTGNAGETMTGPLVYAIYPSEGSRTVVLTVTDAAGQTTSTTRTLYAAPIPGDAPPVALVGVSCVGLQCDVGAGGSDDKSILRTYINLGTGSDGLGIWATRLTTTYQPGTYTVTVTAVDGVGQMARASQTITVAPLPPPNQAPVASFTYSCVRTKCTFDGRSSTDDAGIVSYVWNPGGGPTGANLKGAVVTHDYKRPGTYSATLTVRDAAGLSGSVTRTVTVTR